MIQVREMYLEKKMQFTTQMSGSMSRTEVMHIYIHSAIINEVTAAPTFNFISRRSISQSG